ncbi:MAG: cupin domain-containing protein [Alphaproteobacteria bacterium]
MSDEHVTRGLHPRPVDAAAVRRDWSKRGYSCTAITDPPGQAWTGFVHDTNEVLTVAAGRLRVEMAGATLELDPGDELYIPRRVPHSVYNADRGDTHWLYGYD